jgi:hypothetical protein
VMCFTPEFVEKKWLMVLIEVWQYAWKWSWKGDDHCGKTRASDAPINGASLHTHFSMCSAAVRPYSSIRAAWRHQRLAIAMPQSCGPFVLKYDFCWGTFVPWCTTVQQSPNAQRFHAYSHCSHPADIVDPVKTKRKKHVLVPLFLHQQSPTN